MLGRFETLNLELMRKMQNRTAPLVADLAAATPSERAVTPVPGVARELACGVLLNGAGPAVWAGNPPIMSGSPSPADAPLGDGVLGSR